MIAQTLTVARLELVATARMKWIRMLSAAFALLAIAAAWSAGAANDLSGADGFARTTMALVPVVVILVPLSALILGVSGQATEAGSEVFLFGQPIDRAAVVVGRWVGESAALGAAVFLGLGVGGGVVAFGSGFDGLGPFAFFVLMSSVLAVVFLSIASAIAAAADRRVVALGAAIFAWFVFVLLYDGVALSVAGWATGRIGGRLLLGSVFGNPADLARIVMLLVAGTPHVLGAAGDAWVRFVGGAAATASWAVAALILWAAVPLAIGARVVRARDL